MRPSDHPEFNQRWQALMRHMDALLSLAYTPTPGKTEWDETVSIAKHRLDRIAACREK